MTEPLPCSRPSATATARAYDSVAALYTELARNELDAHPLDRGLLAAFAEHVQVSDVEPGTVAELGCGSGRITALLRDLGLEVFGVDLSPVMIDIARQTYPDLRFEVGAMDDLDLPDGELAGVVAWYSVIHALPEELPAYLAEFRRVLAPGGHLLLAFFESEDDPVTEFDHRVAPAYRWPIDHLAGLAGEAGFAEIGRLLRSPIGGERFRRGRLLMRAPADGGERRE
ncbi:class I SAM-dependent DNA methyltransferase [Nocardiopsis valliformis]|uniref:class I SAM-dependent DNA methyltransferase n=1 Tax=Nocardiopsis valliformis TaxID=239974 RepID=UPI0003631032|nr:class I SAM-dependent methyltransferase [Nocardiopsis valliformis]